MCPAANQVKDTYCILRVTKMAGLSIKTLSRSRKESNGKLSELSPRALPNNKAQQHARAFFCTRACVFATSHSFASARFVSSASSLRALFITGYSSL